MQHGLCRSGIVRGIIIGALNGRVEGLITSLLALNFEENLSGRLASILQRHKPYITKELTFLHPKIEGCEINFPFTNQIIHCHILIICFQLELLFGF
jgi:hypothetical protein